MAIYVLLLLAVPVFSFDYSNKKLTFGPDFDDWTGGHFIVEGDTARTIIAPRMAHKYGKLERALGDTIGRKKAPISSFGFVCGKKRGLFIHRDKYDNFNTYHSLYKKRRYHKTLFTVSSDNSLDEVDDVEEYQGDFDAYNSISWISSASSTKEIINTFKAYNYSLLKLDVMESRAFSGPFKVSLKGFTDAYGWLMDECGIEPETSE